MQVLALDVGAGTVRAAVVDVDTLAIAGDIQCVEFKISVPTAQAAECRAADVWSAVAKAARRVAPAKDAIDGVGMSCLAPCGVWLDAKDQPLTSVWLPADRRSRPAARQTWALDGERFLAEVGTPPVPGRISAIVWKQLLAQDAYLGHWVRSYLHLNGWLGFQMTGERRFDPAGASLTGLFGTMTERRWLEHWCSHFEVNSDWLPEVVAGTQTIGTLRSEAAGEMGMIAGVPVKVGTETLASALLAAGAEPGDVLIEEGESPLAASLTVEPHPAVDCSTYLFPFEPNGAKYICVVPLPFGIEAFSWLHRLCFAEMSETTFFEEALDRAVEQQTSVCFDPPWLAGHPLAVEAQHASFRGLCSATERIELLAAMVQALRRGWRRALRTLGLERPGRLFLSGGNVSVWKKVLPELAGISIHEVQDASLRGAAIMFQQKSVSR
ncbi:MAG: hypothetical protein KatS3mg105_1614 [Gemmatales bacterium]|nr:MAG: hypothetical protein KatS3mg105_1614 [Gemmatales bacterium]